MVNPQSRIGSLTLTGIAVAIFSCFALAPVHAQDGPISESAPAWSTPIDDVTGQPVHYSTGVPAATPVTPVVGKEPAHVAAIRPKPSSAASFSEVKLVKPKYVAKAASKEVPKPVRALPAIASVNKIGPLTPAATIGATPVVSHAYTRTYPVRAVATPAPEQWTGTTGMTLEGMLTHWCADAHVRLVWNPNFQYTLVAPLKFQGTFEQAIAEVFALYHGASHPMSADFYPKQQVLVISGRSE